MLLSSSDTIRVTLMHLFLFTNTAQRELFQYVRREYATANKFPCIITLEPGIRKRWNKTCTEIFFSSFRYRSMIPFTAVPTRLPIETTVLIYKVCLLLFRIPCNYKLLSFISKLLNKQCNCTIFKTEDLILCG